MTESMLPSPITGYWAEPGAGIDTYGPAGGLSAGFLTLGNAAAAAWPTANLAIFVPIQVRRAVNVLKLWYSSGATATGTIDIGVYDSVGNRKISLTNTNKGGVGEIYGDTTNTGLTPGLYYMGLVNSTNSDTFFFSSTAPAAPIAAALGVLTAQLGSAVLPDPAGWAIDQTVTRIPAMGLSVGTVL